MFGIGIDLGKMRNPTTIAIVHRPDTFARTVLMRPYTVISERRTGPSALVYLATVRLGTSYVDVVERIRQVARHEALGGQARRVVVDATGVGLPVVDMLRRAKLGCELRPVTITGGTGERHSSGTYYVAKTDLMAGLRARLELKELEIGEGLAEWAEFRKQMVGFGTAAQDDLVLAVALAVWGVKGSQYGERSDGPMTG